MTTKFGRILETLLLTMIVELFLAKKDKLGYKKGKVDWRRLPGQIMLLGRSMRALLILRW
jgi:hypothetical protein